MKVFISYRRMDSQIESQSIYESLVSEIGEENVFFDVDSIPYGVNFKTYLDGMISDCTVMLVMLGKGWASCCDENGRRRFSR